jgi:GH25 family lysozyme M1 (1,4-beta-N-acetylmuramidase)
MSTAKGVDVSTWQHPNGAAIDWERVLDAGYVFVIAKVTQGTSYVNPWALRDIEDAQAAGLLVGAYHFFEAGAEPGLQAKHFYTQLVGQKLDLGYWLDWEPGPMENYQASAQYNAFMVVMEEVSPSCGVYCDLSHYEALKQVNVDIHRLWLADYSTEPKLGELVWQDSQTGTVPGIAAPVDVDVLTSTRGLNIPTAPPARPTAATTHAVTLEDEPEEVPPSPDEPPSPSSPPPSRDESSSTPEP